MYFMRQPSLQCYAVRRALQPKWLLNLCMGHFWPLQSTALTTNVPVQVRRARLPVALPQVLAVSAALQDRADLAYWLPAAEPANPAEGSVGFATAAPASHPAANGAPAGGAQRSTGDEGGDEAESNRDPDRLRNAAEGAAGEQRGAGLLSGNGAVGEPTTAGGGRDPGTQPDRSEHTGDVAAPQPPAPQPPSKEHPWLPLALEVRLSYTKPCTTT